MNLPPAVYILLETGRRTAMTSEQIQSGAEKRQVVRVRGFLAFLAYGKPMF